MSVLIVTPHSSGAVPTEVLAQMLGEKIFDSSARAERLEWIAREGDPYTDLIFHVPGALNIQAIYSRFVVDLNRPRDRRGSNGVIKLTDFEENSWYPEGFALSEAQYEERLQRYWDSFYAELDRLVSLRRPRLLIDGHSMQPQGPVIGPDKGRPRPALCLMAGEGDNTTLNAEQAEAVMGLLERHFAPVVAASGYPNKDIALNSPWNLDELSLRYKQRFGIPAFGLEFNRALFTRYLPDGEAPDDGAIAQLNRAFRSFVDDLEPLF
ncbi:MAG: N-formylglutamate amidohydrolase [Meiothermus sp.]|nr:N-formylglutamate amidohydrolase [Meiothermus sp.]